MPKYINADALTKRIDDELCKPCRDAKQDYNGVLCRACRVDDMLILIDSEPTADVREVMNSVWIPVSERLPKVDAECIISLDNSIELATFTGEDFHAEWYDYEIAEVKAWMPSPEPYKADKWGDFPYKGENIPQGNGLP